MSTTNVESMAALPTSTTSGITVSQIRTDLHEIRIPSDPSQRASLRLILIFRRMVPTQGQLVMAFERLVSLPMQQSGTSAQSMPVTLPCIPANGGFEEETVERREGQDGGNESVHHLLTTLRPCRGGNRSRLANDRSTVNTAAGGSRHGGRPGDLLGGASQS